MSTALAPLRCRQIRAENVAAKPQEWKNETQLAGGVLSTHFFTGGATGDKNLRRDSVRSSIVYSEYLIVLTFLDTYVSNIIKFYQTEEFNLILELLYV
jgi:hypothetical protein